MWWPFNRKPPERGPERAYVWRQSWSPHDGVATVVYMLPGVQLQHFRIDTVDGHHRLTVVAVGHWDKFGPGWLPLERPDPLPPTRAHCAHCREPHVVCVARCDKCEGLLCVPCAKLARETAV